MVQGRRSTPIDITLELQEETGDEAPEVEPAGFPSAGGMSGRRALGRSASRVVPRAQRGPSRRPPGRAGTSANEELTT